MTVIADTSPIHYGVLIGLGDLFFTLYGTLIVPGAVFRECSHPGAPPALRDWLQIHKDRITVTQVSPLEAPELSFLGPGEREAIVLALRLPNSLLLIDDRLGRREADARGIHTTGLVGFIRDAAIDGHVDFNATIERLRRTSFRISEEAVVLARREYLKKSTSKRDILS